MDQKFGRWWNTKDFTNYTSNRETAMESWDAGLETYGVKEMVAALKNLLYGYVDAIENHEIEVTGKDPGWTVRHKQDEHIQELCGCDDAGPCCYCQTKSALARAVEAL